MTASPHDPYSAMPIDEAIGVLWTASVRPANGSVWSRRELAERSVLAELEHRIGEFERARRLGFEQGMAKCQEYTAAAEQDERDAAKRRGEPVPGTRETVKVALVAAVVASLWREQREHPQHQYEPVGPALAARLDALLAQVDEALAATEGR